MQQNHTQLDWFILRPVAFAQSWRMVHLVHRCARIQLCEKNIFIIRASASKSGHGGYQPRRIRISHFRVWVTVEKSDEIRQSAHLSYRIRVSIDFRDSDVRSKL